MLSKCWTRRNQSSKRFIQIVLSK